MINIWVKSGLIQKKSIVSFIFQHNTHRWLITKILHCLFTKKEIDAVGILLAIKHINNKYLNSPINIFIDSSYLLTVLEQNEDGEFIQQNSSVKLIKLLRDKLIEMPNINIKQTLEDDNYQELDHVFQECGLDEIELNEKES